MIKLPFRNQTASFSIETPQMSAYNIPCINHQLSISFSDDVNTEAVVTVSATCSGAENAEEIANGVLSAVDLVGKTKTVFVYGVLLENIVVDIADRTAGTIRADYVGYGQNDPGI